MHLAREVAAVADPHRERLRSERPADLDALEVVRDRLPAHSRVRMGEAAELVRELLTRLILEGVRVHRVEVQPALGRERPQRSRVLRASHGMCSETAGVERTSLKIMPQSSSFS